MVRNRRSGDERDRGLNLFSVSQQVVSTFLMLKNQQKASKHYSSQLLRSGFRAIAPDKTLAELARQIQRTIGRATTKQFIYIVELVDYHTAPSLAET